MEMVLRPRANHPGGGDGVGGVLHLDLVVQLLAGIQDQRQQAGQQEEEDDHHVDGLPALATGQPAQAISQPPPGPPPPAFA
jgi:hypothetical protein